MTRLAARLVRDIEQRAGLPRGSRVVVALSGGADSVSLLWLLLECAPAAGLEVVSIAHLNHGLRGPAAQADEQFCRELAAGVSLPIDVERVDVRGMAAARGLSLEHAGHEARRAFFERVVASRGAHVVATGHTMNDQAETFLMRAARGASARGLAGMAPRSGVVVRPLLWTGRDALTGYLRRRGLAWREDATNEELSIQRNRFRHQVLPVLERVAPGALAALARAADSCREDERWLEQAATAAGAAVVQYGDGAPRVGCADLLALAPPVQSRVVRQLLAETVGRRLTRPHVEAVIRLAGSPRPEGRVDLPGCAVEKRAGQLAVTLEGPGGGREEPAAPASLGDGGRRLPVPGTLEEPEARWVLDVRAAPWPGEPPAPHGRDAAVVDAGVVGGELLVRYRRRGDRLRPLGVGGRKSVHDLFVDRKVPRAERDRVPIVTDGRGRIVWVAGHGISEEFRVTPGTTSVLLLNFRRSGGAG
jgi:tRNA(Ile)-lysidine synthase